MKGRSGAFFALVVTALLLTALLVGAARPAWLALTSPPLTQVAIHLHVTPDLMSAAHRLAAAATLAIGAHYSFFMSATTAAQAVPAVKAGILSVALVSDDEAAPVPAGRAGQGSRGAGHQTLGRLPVVIGVPSIGARPHITTAQAVSLARGQADPALDLGGGPGKYELVGSERFVAAAGAGQLRAGQVAALRLEDLGPAIAALPVDGVLPEPATVSARTYQISRGVRVLWAGNSLSLPSRLWAMLAGSQLAQAAKFVRWLHGSDAWAQIVGVGDLVTLAAVGDVMLDRGVGRWIDKSGPLYPFEATRGILSAADIAVCNLESPLGTGGRRAAGKSIFFQAAPESGQGLVSAGFDLVSLANNHTVDYGREGLLECLDHLRELGIGYFGGGRDLAEARAPAVVDTGGVRVAFLGCSEFADMYWSMEERFTFEAGADRPGVAPLRQPYSKGLSVADANPYLAEDIARARELADVVVVSVHWGVEYTNEPAPFQLAAAQFMVDAGADLVLGHHPHAVQGLLPSGNALVAFSLGNFVFDQPWPETQESMILQLKLSNRGIFAWDFEPVQITACQPRPADLSPEGQLLMDKIIDLSWQLYVH